jgi:hypothetical protein
MSDAGSTAPILIQIARVLRRARKLPIGPARNDLRQLARALINLHRTGIRVNVQIIEPPTKH